MMCLEYLGFDGVLGGDIDEAVLEDYVVLHGEGLEVFLGVFGSGNRRVS
jgi:hypothetical protein